MKVYFYLNVAGFSNCYIVVNERTDEALMIDPGKVTSPMIELLERGGYKLCAILVTHNHGSHVHGIKTLTKIYSPKVYGADSNIAASFSSSSAMHVLIGDGRIRIAGLTIEHIAIPGHTIDSIMYKIGNIIFTGDAISAGSIGRTSSSYSANILRDNILKKVLLQNNNTILMPGHGPPTTVGCERAYNSGINYNEKVDGLFSCVVKRREEEVSPYIGDGQ